MIDKDKKFGRTFYDFIAEHPKRTFFIFLGILGLAILLIIFRVPFKVGSVEVGKDTDTIVKIQPETIYVEKKAIAPKEIKFAVSKGLITKKDSLGPSKTQSNINNGVNNGIIGNNNNVKVDVNEIQRKLDTQSKIKLLDLIYECRTINKLPENVRIVVYAAEGNSEVYNFSNEILDFLKSKKFNLQENVEAVSRMPRVKGVEIDYSMDVIQVLIGYK